MRWLGLICLAGCASFEDPTIVLDLRVIGVETTPPEQVLDIDPGKPPTVDELLAQLQPVRVRARVAQPDRMTELYWTLTACLLDEGSRCDPEAPAYEIAGGILDDPETFAIGAPCRANEREEPGVVCGVLAPDGRLVQLLAKAQGDDPSGGLAGLDVGVVLRVRDVVNDPPVEAFAAKRVRFAPRIPADRLANTNPHIDQLLIGRAGFGIDVMEAHCGKRGATLAVPGGQRVTLFPVSRDADKEAYVLPTLDGQAAYFTEHLTYQWIATHGDFTDEITGGPPDVFGNVRLDGTEWTPPEVTDDTLVTVWVVQRDSRYGVRWWESCIMVEP